MAKLVLGCIMYDNYKVVTRQEVVIKTGNWDDLMKELPPSYTYPEDLISTNSSGTGIDVWRVVFPENDEEQKELIQTGRIVVIGQDGHPLTVEEAIHLKC